MVATNPFFATTASHFVIPSVGDKIDNAAAQAKATASGLKDQAYNRAQDLKEVAKDSVSTNPTGVDLYARFALAGALGCAVTHGALTPVDVVKTRIQLEPEVYNRVSIFQSFIFLSGETDCLNGANSCFVVVFFASRVWLEVSDRSSPLKVPVLC
jgi:solute carrier family 25 phosphate transporter 3